MMAKLSIITINLNNKEGLEQTIKSVHSQTHLDIEHLIIDGGSTDGSLDIINKYADKLYYWVSESDKGIYDAINKGIDKATGEWLSIMNSGDIFCDNTTVEDVFKEWNEIKNEKAEFLYSDMCCIDKKTGEKYYNSASSEFAKVYGI